jgi:hypothetical protein
MRLSYSLLRRYQECEFLAKVERIDHVTLPLESEHPLSRWRRYAGIAAHAGQRALLLGCDAAEAVSEAVSIVPESCLVGWTRATLHQHVLSLVHAWWTDTPGVRWSTMTPLAHDGTALLDERLVVKLPAPIGLFEELVIVPDAVLVDAQGRPWLYDWKWVAQLGDPDAQAWDLQSALYQWGLHLLGYDLRGHAIVQGLLDPAPAFQVTKAGRVSTRPSRNTWEDYARACAAAGHEPEERMRGRLGRRFVHHVNFRPMSRVRGIWEDTITPLAQRLSDAIEGKVPFIRRLSWGCQRCPVRQECLDGMTGNSQTGAFNTIYTTRKETS